MCYTTVVVLVQFICIQNDMLKQHSLLHINMVESMSSTREEQKTEKQLLVKDSVWNTGEKKIEEQIRKE